MWSSFHRTIVTKILNSAAPANPICRRHHVVQPRSELRVPTRPSYSASSPHNGAMERGRRVLVHPRGHRGLRFAAGIHPGVMVGARAWPPLLAVRPFGRRVLNACILILVSLAAIVAGSNVCLAVRSTLAGDTCYVLPVFLCLTPSQHDAAMRHLLQDGHPALLLANVSIKPWARPTRRSARASASSLPRRMMCCHH